MGVTITAGPSAFGNTITDANLYMNGSIGVPGDLVFSNLFGGGSVTFDVNPTTLTNIIGFPNNTGDVPVTGNATAPPNAAQKIGKVNLTAQTANIGSLPSQVKLTNGAPVGMYLVNAALSCTTIGAGTLVAHFTWTGDGGSTPVTLTRTMTATGPSTMPVSLYLASGDITYYVDGYSSGQFAVRIRVSYLGI